MDEIFDHKFLLKKLTIETKDVPADKIPKPILKIIAYIFCTMKKMNSSYYDYNISYPKDSPLEGINVHIRATFPDYSGKPKLIDKIKKVFNKKK